MRFLNDVKRKKTLITCKYLYFTRNPIFAKANYKSIIS